MCKKKQTPIEKWRTEISQIMKYKCSPKHKKGTHPFHKMKNAN